MQILFRHLMIKLRHRVHYAQILERQRLVVLSGKVSRHLFVLEKGLLGAVLLELVGCRVVIGRLRLRLGLAL